MQLETLRALLSFAFIATGVLFFVAGTMGMLRFPDVYNRLHALTKSDNLGFGLVALGLVVVAPTVFEALKVVTIWLFVLVASTTSAHLVARVARQREEN